MSLFDSLENEPVNLLPSGGEAIYFGKVLSAPEADRYFEKLLAGIEWRNDEAVIFGKRIVTKRKAAWYGDSAFRYTYSKTTKTALPWTDDLLALKKLTEEKTGETYNSCLLNLYHDGSEAMSWHSDAEKELKKNGAIASMSLGAERKFAFRHKQSGETLSVLLEHGSLLVMKGETQRNWLHRLPPSKRVLLPRINLTFRTIAEI